MTKRLMNLLADVKKPEIRKKLNDNEYVNVFQFAFIDQRIKNNLNIHWDYEILKEDGTASDSCSPF